MLLEDLLDSTILGELKHRGGVRGDLFKLRLQCFALSVALLCALHLRSRLRQSAYQLLVSLEGCLEILGGCLARVEGNRHLFARLEISCLQFGRSGGHAPQ